MLLESLNTPLRSKIFLFIEQGYRTEIYWNIKVLGPIGWYWHILQTSKIWATLEHMKYFSIM